MIGGRDLCWVIFKKIVVKKLYCTLQTLKACGALVNCRALKKIRRSNFGKLKVKPDCRIRDVEILLK